MDDSKSSIHAYHGVHPVPAVHHHNVMRRYRKNTVKPRKDYHQKIYKNPLENLEALSEGGAKKTQQNFPALFLLAVLGGIYVGFGGLVALTVAGGVSTTWSAAYPGIQKLLVGLTFPIALILIIVAGAELFTSNIMYTTLGLLRRNVNPLKTICVCICVFLGNYLGTVMVAGFSVKLAGFLTTEPYRSFHLSNVQHKLDTDFGTEVLKAIPANFLVNVAVIMASAAEDILGKIVAGYLPILVFAVVGMEHCIANDFYVHAAAFIQPNFSYGTWLWKLLIASTLGNCIGGMFVGASYWYVYLAEHQLGKNHWFLSFRCCCCAKPSFHDDEEPNPLTANGSKDTMIEMQPSSLDNSITTPQPTKPS